MEGDSSSDNEDMTVATQIETDFNAAANYVQKVVAQLDKSLLLEFYGLYKQSMIGKCDTPKPGMFGLQAKAKWNAWNQLGDMPKNAAQLAYISKLTDLYPDWNKGAATAAGTGAAKPKSEQWVSVSVPQIQAEDMVADVAEADKTCLDFVKDGNVEALRLRLDAAGSDRIKPHLSALDDTGLAMLHWAADRGNAAVLQLLLEHGVEVNIVDNEGQTAMHYAAMVGHLECVRVLLRFDADLTIRDAEGQTCVDVAEDAEIVALLKSVL